MENFSTKHLVKKAIYDILIPEVAFGHSSRRNFAWKWIRYILRLRESFQYYSTYYSTLYTC